MSNSRCLVRRAPPPTNLPFVTATHLFRQLRSGSRGVIALCEDGKYYVVHLVGNPEGPNALANEELGSRLASSLRLCVAPTSIVYIPKRLMKGAPAEWFTSFHFSNRPIEDLHLGTMILGDPQGVATTDLVGFQQVAGIANRSDFFGIMLLDVLSNNQGPRRALFTRLPGVMRLQVNFTGHSQMFGGGSCIFDDARQDGVYFRHSVYRGIWDEQMLELMHLTLERCLGQVLEDFYKEIPAEWYDSRHVSVEKTLFTRLSRLSSLLGGFKSLFDEGSQACKTMKCVDT